MAVKYTCDSCAKELDSDNDLFHITIKNGHNTAIITEDISPDLCKDCATAIVEKYLPIVDPEQPILT